MVTLPVERVRARRAAIDPTRVFLTILTALFFAPGWLARKAFIVAWWAISFAAACAIEGWNAAAPPDRGGGR